MYSLDYIKNLNFTITISLFLIIFLSKTLFILTGFVLEDSFILFRSAFNFADYDVFSYNIDENYSATTSKIYGLICAFFRQIFKEHAILSIIIFNSILSFFSSLLIFKSIQNLFNLQKKILSEKNIIFLIIILFLNPSILIIGIVGLEFSILVFFISLVLLGVIKNNNLLISFVLIIPLIRVELIGFVLILSFFYLYFLRLKNFMITIFFGIFGLLLNLYLNNLFDNSFFPGTAISKWNALETSGDFSLDRILANLNYWFFNERSFFLGVYSKYIPNLIYTLIGMAVVIYALSNLRYLIFNKFKNINLNEKIFIMTISSSIIFLPLAYVISGHVWDWYLYKYSFLTYTLLAIFSINLKNFDKIRNFFILGIFLISFFQFLVLKNIGNQENSYRSLIGKDINNLSDNKFEDTLFLEPAGYIPYFAKIKTFDTEGLVSPKIFKYRNQKNNRWWLDFIEENKPTFIVDRKNIFKGFSQDGKYNLNDNEIIWFRENYELVKEYNYHKFINSNLGIFQSFYLLGNHSDYFLYKKISN